ncbi:MAG TPA: methyltransferase domain-containing protein [Allosphingosinicella sp.]|nr:methyltransferase domain-containing protein [Allosphingosinicella sp.]
MRASDQLFDPRLRRLRRARAARSGRDADFLRRRAADELVARLALVARPFATALDLGWGDPYLAFRLRERGIHVVQCDEERLPFASGPFDLAVSVGALDTINDLPGALTLIRRALKPDGLFLAAFAGAGSLPRLRRAMRAAEEAEGAGAAPRIHPQIDVRAAGDLLARAGFALPVVDRDVVEVRYGALTALVADLRAMGATNQLAGQDARPVRRKGLAAAIADFAADAGPDGKTAERFEIVHLSGWAPAPDQPQPAPRGSGTASLADALKSRR